MIALRPRSTTSAKRRIKMVPAPGFYELGKWHPRVLQKLKPIQFLDKFCLKHGFGNPFGTRLLWEKTQHTHEVINCICINIIEISNQVWSLISIPDASSQVLEDCMFLFAFRHANHLRGQSHQVFLQSCRCVYIYMYICTYVYIHMLYSKNRLSIYRILHTSCQLTPPRESLKSVSYTSPAYLFKNCEATIQTNEAPRFLQGQVWGHFSHWSFLAHSTFAPGIAIRSCIEGFTSATF